MPTFLFLITSLLSIVGLVTLSAFFSSSETAIFTLSDDWSEGLVDSGDRNVSILADLRSDPHRLLVTILVGDNIVNVAIASIITVVATGFLPAEWAVTTATIVASFIVLVFGEIVPKSYGHGNALRWALVVAWPLHIVERFGYPLVRLFDGITRRINRVLAVRSGMGIEIETVAVVPPDG